MSVRIWSPFAAGAVLAALAGLLGAGGPWPAIAFALVSLGGLAAAQAVARSRPRTPSEVRGAAATLIGKHAIVLEQIANHEGAGCVKIDGEVWTARAFDGNRVIERGKRVEVIEVKGATALVIE